MSFNRYIYELLLDNEVVIIPDFGAFVTSLVSSRTDAMTGNLLPPSKVVRFDPRIRSNDFLLINYVAEKEGITEHEATRKVRKICDEILYRLDNGERIDFENTGILYFDINKELCFEPAQDALLHLDAYGLEPVILELNAEKQEKAETPTPSQSSARKKSGYLWFFLVIPIIAGAYFGFKMLKKPEISKTRAPVQEKVLPDSLPSRDSIIQNTEIQTVVTEKKDTITGKKYFVIGGSFEEEVNAREFISKMEKKGYKPFVVEKKGRFYIVALDVFTTLREAGDFKRSLEKETKDTSIWILPD